MFDFDSIHKFFPLETEIRKDRAVIDHKAICPFHKDTTPSLHIYEDRFYCFGCGVFGDVVDWFAKLYGCDIFRAYCELAIQCGLPVPVMDLDFQNELDTRKVITHYVRRCHLEMKRQIAQSSTIAVYAQSVGLSDTMICQWNLGIGLKPTQEEQSIGISSGFENRLIYPVYDGSYVVNLIGRLPNCPEGIPKTINMKGRSLVPFNKSRLTGDSVVIVEGPKDCVLVESLGYKSTAIIGTVFGGWNVKPNTAVYLCLDKDDSGSQATIKHAKRIASQRVYVVSLPDEKDPADIINQDPSAFRGCMNTAVPFLDYWIDTFDWKGMDIYEKEDALKQVLLEVAKSQTQDAHLAKLKVVSGETLGSLKRRLEKLSDVWSISWYDTMPKIFRPSQFFHNGILYYTLPIPVTSGELMMHTVTSRRELFPLCKEELVARGFIITNTVPDQIISRWSTDTVSTHGVHAYLNQKFQSPTSADTFSEIQNSLKRFLMFGNRAEFSLISLWLMHTYIYMAFDVTPYLHLHGMKGSGKTKALSLIQQLAFNGMLTTNTTESALTRSVNNNQSTFALDEVEQLNEITDRNISILSVLHSGFYRYGDVPKSVKVEGGDWQAGMFFAYSPKAFGSIRQINDTLSDRCLVIHTDRSRTISDESVEAHYEMLANVRDKLYGWAMGNINLIIGHPVLMPDHLFGRWRDLWKPILMIANSVSVDVFEQMCNLSASMEKQKRLLEDETHREKMIFYAVIEVMKYYRRWELASAQNWYTSGEILQFVMEQSQYKTSYRYLNSVIFDILKLADREIDRKRMTIDSHTSWSIRLVPELVAHRAQVMFGETIDWEN